MEDEENNATPSEIVPKDTLVDLAADVSEVVLDQVLSDGVLKDLPVIGSVVKVARAVRGVNDTLFLHKMDRFCNPLADISQHDRERFLEEIEGRGNPQRDAQLLLLHINQLNDVPKATLLGIAFRAVVLREFDFVTFQRIALALDTCLLADLEHLRDAGGDQIYISSLAERSLASVGLLESRSGVIRRPDGTSEVFFLSSLGERFRDFVLRKCEQLVPKSE